MHTTSTYKCQAFHADDADNLPNNNVSLVMLSAKEDFDVLEDNDNQAEIVNKQDTTYFVQEELECTKCYTKFLTHNALYKHLDKAKHKEKISKRAKEITVIESSAPPAKQVSRLDLVSYTYMEVNISFNSQMSNIYMTVVDTGYGSSSMDKEFIKLILPKNI
ncbi:hypothetical protein L228DRAFT_235393 [Xylona heveae TC161]|uniref:C2H2-type domain-containing protein n=1 Tax=Xylona heveae (strain CBS 132557 / TC161) TaxID=1328760 RepID=A0A165JJ08_XYLHT|nr:hypothetical protein L228DRAFT_235393 [Xylona heveae TC161]KZF26304.1 hypothetical protein L228DRAFT_235393 [Xylona heveae TC161]